MEGAKSAKGKGLLSSVNYAQARAGKNHNESTRSEGQKVLRKKSTEDQVCRYCGSDDLAPSFVKRRDRRCRKCFSRRYGSVARAKKARAKK
jgi:hypothetical protein